jgi:hypothetical protein
MWDGRALGIKHWGIVHCGGDAEKVLVPLWQKTSQHNHELSPFAFLTGNTDIGMMELEDLLR